MSAPTGKPTRGPWEAEPMVGRGAWIGRDGEWAALSCGKTDEEAAANARLIAEAGTVYHSTGRTPRELEKECETARAALRLVRSIIVDASMVGFNCNDGDWAERLFASQAVTRAALSPAGGGE